MATTLMTANRVSSANVAGLRVGSVCRCRSQQTNTSARVLPLLILTLLIVSATFGCIGHTQKENKAVDFSAKDYVKEAKKYYENDDMQKAMENIEKAISINPKLPKAYMMRARIREALEDPDFEDDYNYAIDLEDGE